MKPIPAKKLQFNPPEPSVSRAQPQSVPKPSAQNRTTLIRLVSGVQLRAAIKKTNQK